jgi:hypothetical protein
MDSIFPKREEQCPRQQITQSQLRRALERGYRESNPVPYADKQKAAKRITPSPRNLARLLGRRRSCLRTFQATIDSALTRYRHLTPLPPPSQYPVS